MSRSELWIGCDLYESSNSVPGGSEWPVTSRFVPPLDRSQMADKSPFVPDPYHRCERLPVGNDPLSRAIGGGRTGYPYEFGESGRCRRKWLHPDAAAAADLRPVASPWEGNIGTSAGFRQTNIGNPYSRCDLRDRSRPHELMEIFSFQVVGATCWREVLQGGRYDSTVSNSTF